MQKLTYTTKNGKFKVELSGQNQKELFRELHKFQEVFEDVASANINGKVEVSDDIRYYVRKGKYTDEQTNKEKEAEYFEARVVSGPLAGFKKAFGVLDDGSDNLFPKRDLQNKDDYIVGYNGWHKYVGKKEENTNPGF